MSVVGQNLKTCRHEFDYFLGLLDMFSIHEEWRAVPLFFLVQTELLCANPFWLRQNFPNIQQLALLEHVPGDTSNDFAQAAW